MPPLVKQLQVPSEEGFRFGGHNYSSFMHAGGYGPPLTLRSVQAKDENGKDAIEPRRAGADRAQSCREGRLGTGGQLGVQGRI